MKLSIVTIVKDNAAGISKTLASVVHYKATGVVFEYLVIDGGSTDGTVEKIIEFGTYIDVYDSRPDDGIADAFNRGIQLSHGTYILMLNSGDSLVIDDTLKIAIDTLGDGDDIIAFGVVSQSSGQWYPPKSFEPGLIPHQGVFVGRDVYKSIGTYIVKFRIRMDYEFLLRAKARNIKYQCFPKLLCNYDGGGVSARRSSRVGFYKEGLQAELMHRWFPHLDTFIRLIYWIIMPARE